MKHYYRARVNPTAPLMVVESEWEAKEMKLNREYDEVDEDGLPVVNEDDITSDEKQFIPFSR